jgi:hypothetical protein
MSRIPVWNCIEVSMPFVPIGLEEYVTKFLANNPGNKRSEVTARLKETLGEFKAGARCACGAPIWVIGSAEVGHACFTCITGEAHPEEDYEIAEACKSQRRLTRR